MLIESVLKHAIGLPGERSRRTIISSGMFINLLVSNIFAKYKLYFFKFMFEKRHTYNQDKILTFLGTVLIINNTNNMK